jgi:5-(carboxyamino)imidazole ribonucleotide mutase
MPAGVPVATVALNGARNAGILAAQIVGCHDSAVLQKIKLFKEDLKSKVMESVADMNKK